MAASGTAIAAGESMVESSPAYAATFANDYPDQDAKAYNLASYDWWKDENGNGIADVTPSVTDNDETMSSRGFGYRNCTDGAAYWLKKYTGVTLPSSMGNAKAWASNAPSGTTVYEGKSNNIEPGDVAQSDDGYYGHVGLVTDVVKNSNGAVISLEIAELNKAGTGLYTHDTYTTKNSSGNFVRSGSNDWDHFIDANGPGKGLDNENIGTSGSASGSNTVLKVIKKNQADGTNLVYWAKANDVFEEWWRPGGDGIHISPLIDISQGDIKDIDMEIKPDGEHLLYTATAHNIWETWWYPGQGLHTAEIVHAGGNIADIQKTAGPDGTDQLYAMTDQGVDEYWWRPGQGVHSSRVYSINNPVAMKKVLEPDGTQELYVADHSYAYRNWWGSDGVVHNGQPIIHIPQADITSMDFSQDANNGTRRLYVGRQQSGVWEASWANNPAQGIATWQVTGDNGVQKIQKWMDGTTNVAYVETAGGVFEYWWLPGSTAVHGAVITAQADVHDFNRATTTDGAQAVYTAANTHIYESYWFPGGNGIHTNAIE
jgi:surface antigen